MTGTPPHLEGDQSPEVAARYTRWLKYIEENGPRLGIECLRLQTFHLARPCRRPTTALSLEAAVWLGKRFLAWRFEHEASSSPNPPVAADLGSGLSTLVLRRLNSDPSVQHIVDGRCVLWTTDDSWRWLGETLYELERQALPTDHCHHDAYWWGLIEPRSLSFVFFDLGDTATRLERIPLLLDRLAPGALLVVDDWQFDHYRTKATPLLVGLRLLETSPEDEHSRVMALFRA